MLAGSELDQFLDEFFGEEENTSCTAGSENQKKLNLFTYRNDYKYIKVFYFTSVSTNGGCGDDSLRHIRPACA